MLGCDAGSHDLGVDAMAYTTSSSIDVRLELSSATPDER